MTLMRWRQSRVATETRCNIHALKAPLALFKALEDRRNHLVPNLTGFWELVRKVACHALEFFSVPVKVAQADSLAPVLSLSVCCPSRAG